ncbi:MAG: C40 family peptidase [Armatimonadetes bacterium]|nr:C40 family peptidase [Armatimonadota bacterium]
MGKNETFASISRRYSTGYERLMAANPKIVPEKLRPGTVITIPGRIREPEKKKVARAGVYVVQNGDTDWSIARRYNIKPSDLRTMNYGVKWTTLQPGAELKVPGKSTTVVAAKQAPAALKNASFTKKPALGKHTVAEDDNDWIIARGYGITPKALRLLNPGVNWNKLHPGMKVNVPAKNGSKVARITTKRARVIRDNVIVRSGARPDSSRLTMVDYGRFAVVADRIGDYYKLRFSGGTSGWVRGDMLAPVTASMVALAERDTGTAIIRRRTHEADTKVARNEQPTRRSSHTTRLASYRPRTGRTAPDTSSSYAMSSEDRDGVIGTAMQNMGVRYRWGGTSTNGFDCSGLTSYVYSRHGVRLPRTAKEQSTRGQAVGRDGLQKGDLVFFKTTRSDRVSHVGIYIGDGKFVHASSGGGRVRVNNISDNYYSKRFAGARRVGSTSSGSSHSGSSKKSSKSSSKEESKGASEEQTAHEQKVEADPKPQTVKGTDAVGR